MQNYENILKELFNNKNKIKLGLKRVESVLHKLGNPHKAIKTIHIAGTNGKGSTACMTASMLQNAGYKVGLFLSPFISDFKECIQINKEFISKDDIVNLYNKINSSELTYFEIKTIMAFLYFFENNVDFAVIETGLGGRLDATNVISPLVSVITNISLEHKEYLGDTIEKIAYEKSGIIKEDTTIITMADNLGLEIIKKTAIEKKSSLITVEVGNKLFTNLSGHFQQKNAYLAKEIINYLRKKFKYHISEENIIEGLLEVQIHGRFEKYDNVIYDCAHNDAAIKVLANEIKQISHEKIISIITIMNDKNKTEMMKQINSFSDYIIFTETNIDRCSNLELLQKLSTKKNEIIKNTSEALKKAKILAKKGDLIIVTGSCYLVGELIPTK